MADRTTALTGGASIERWLADPEGGPLLRKLLADAGFDETVLAPVRLLPLEQLAALSQGALTTEMVEDLVRAANGGIIPESPEPRRERISEGRFDGMTVIVTGAGSGIGRATASRIAREGGRVVALDISQDRLEELSADLSGFDVVTVGADITSSADIDRAVAAAGERIDALANVAGITDDFSPLHEVSDALWQKVFSVNVDGMFKLSRAVLPAMLSAGSGSIVNVASEAALRGSAAGAAYTASKHAVLGLTSSAAFMYGPSGIRVNAVAPGGVATGMATAGTASEFGQDRLRPFMALIPPIATAEQLAASITFLLSDDSANINGAVLTSDGGWSVQ